MKKWLLSIAIAAASFVAIAQKNVSHAKYYPTTNDYKKNSRPQVVEVTYRIEHEDFIKIDK